MALIWGRNKPEEKCLSCCVNRLCELSEVAHAAGSFVTGFPLPETQFLQNGTSYVAFKTSLVFTKETCGDVEEVIYYAQMILKGCEPSMHAIFIG